MQQVVTLDSNVTGYRGLVDCDAQIEALTKQDNNIQPQRLRTDSDLVSLDRPHQEPLATMNSHKVSKHI